MTITAKCQKCKKTVEPIKPYGILAAPPCTMFSLARSKANL